MRSESIENSNTAQLKADNAELANKWLKEIDRRRSAEKTWRTKAQDVIDRYRDDRKLDDSVAKFNILWSNTETIKPAIFARMPIPDVRRRWSTKDAAARTAALILERSLSFINSTFNFKDVLNRVNEDYVLPGRAMATVCYEPLILQRQIKKMVEPDPPSSPPEGAEQGDDGKYYQMQPEEYKAWESVYVEYTDWKLFGFSECKEWAKCPAMWFGDYLNRTEIEKLCPDFKDIQALQFKDASNDELDKEKSGQPPQTVLIWKVWHKAARKFMIFAEGYADAPLLVMDDPTQLEGFYPAPEPMYSLRTNGNWTPKPEYLLYQDQANELDDISQRMRALINACKNRGVYDKAMDNLVNGEIGNLYKKPDNTFVAVDNFRSIAEKGGLEALLSTLPLEQIIACIQQLREREQELKEQIYELYGISDIMRGASKASETLGAQKLKAQYGGLRISTRQERFQEFIREIYRIEAELIAEHFDPDTLRIMCGLQVVPDQQYMQLKQQQQLEAGMVSQSEFDQAIQIIKSDKLRGFKVDIETDSTIPVDNDSEQQNRIAFMSAIGSYLQGVIPAVQSGSIPASVAREGLLFVVRGFKVGTEFEEVLEELGNDSGDSAAQLQQLQQQVQQMQQQMQEMQQENQQLKAGAQVEMQKAQMKQQTDQQNAQLKAQTEMQKHDAQSQLAAQVAEREAAAQLAEQQRLLQVEQWKIESEERQLAMKLENERVIADARNQTTIQVAEISAKAAQTAQANTAASYDSEESVD